MSDDYLNEMVFEGKEKYRFAALKKCGMLKVWAQIPLRLRGFHAFSSSLQIEKAFGKGSPVWAHAWAHVRFNSLFVGMVTAI